MKYPKFIKGSNFGGLKSFDIDLETENPDGTISRNMIVLVGKRSAGKTVFMKLVAALESFDLACNHKKHDSKTATTLFQQSLEGFAIGDLVSDKTEIFFQGEFGSYHFLGQLMCVLNQEGNGEPGFELNYIPSERNLPFSMTIDNYLGDTGHFPKYISTYFKNFFINAQSYKLREIKIPGVDIEFKYSNLRCNLDFRYPGETKWKPISVAPSGIKSMIPLCLAVLMNKGFSNSSKSVYVVDDLDQFLDHELICDFLNFLVDSMKSEGSFIFSANSPYVINQLSLCVKSFHLSSIGGKMDETQKIEFDKLMGMASPLNPGNLGIYQILDGHILKLGNYQGIPSDHNILNERLSIGNEIFADMLDLEQSLKRDQV